MGLALVLIVGGALFLTGGRALRASVTTTTSAPAATTTTSTTTPPTVTIAAVGDTELGNTPQLPPDPTAYLGAMKAALAAPIVFGNLEGTITDLTASKCAAKSTYCYAFRVPTSYARVYRSAGFTVLNSANNHAYDFLQAGASATTAALRAAGIVQAGLPNQIGVVSDGPLKVAFVDFAPYYNTNNMLNQSVANQLVARAHQLANVVVVYMHAGAEGPSADHVTRATETFVGENRGNPYAFAHAVIDAGADLVVASGPHVLRGLEWYHGHLIDFSLGDFVNYYNFATVGDLRLSAILHVTLGANGSFASGRFTSLVLEPSGAAQLDPTHAAATFVNQLSQQDFGPAAATVQPDGTISPPPTQG
ncbi:MAG TPA: CapA family protein [Acidimicrobiales bacterium]|nr:CapA family protein [Acidimicrobiales bacterium]